MEIKKKPQVDFIKKLSFFSLKNSVFMVIRTCHITPKSGVSAAKTIVSLLKSNLCDRLKMAFFKKVQPEISKIWGMSIFRHTEASRWRSKTISNFTPRVPKHMTISYVQRQKLVQLYLRKNKNLSGAIKNKDTVKIGHLL
jgi:hypothetical protein